jgi:hypothetical protein
MSIPLAREIALLPRLTVKELQAKYAEVFGEQARAHNKPWLVKRVAWRMQALAEGGLSERARLRAAELANDADLRVIPPKAALETPRVIPIRTNDRLPTVGSVITRSYKGETINVKVLADGFEYEGQFYKSLSAVAKAVSGSHCNGYLFFRIPAPGGSR